MFLGLFLSAPQRPIDQVRHSKQNPFLKMSSNSNRQVTELIASLKNPKEMSTEAFNFAMENIKEKLVEWHQQLLGLRTQALENPKRAKPGLDSAPEGVGAASAARSPGESTVERAYAAAPPVPPPRLFSFPKNLVIDMVDDLAPTEATGRGQRIHKPRKIFEQVAEPSKGKRNRAAVKENTAATAALPLSKKRATRAVSRTALSTAPQPIAAATAKNKRKRAADLNEAAATAPASIKKRATSRAASSTHLSIGYWCHRYSID